MQGVLVALALCYTPYVCIGNSLKIPNDEVSFSIPPKEDYGTKDNITMNKGKPIIHNSFDLYFTIC